MISRTLRDRANTDATRMAEKQRGVPASHLRMNSQRVAEILVPTLNRLPCKLSQEQLQDNDGNFYFLAGYSAVGGPDL